MRIIERWIVVNVTTLEVSETMYRTEATANKKCAQKNKWSEDIKNQYETSTGEGAQWYAHFNGKFPKFEVRKIYFEIQEE